MVEPDPAAVSVVNPTGASPVVLICEHASRYIPARYAGLGLSEPDLSRHIAWDIGAALLARALSSRLDAPLFLHGYSRLLIDPNRPLYALDSIPVTSEDTIIPGNQRVSEEERRDRVARFFTPFHDAVTRHLDARRDTGRPALIVGVHSFTPVFRGEHRPWDAGVLYGAAEQFGQALLASLGTEPGLTLGANVPYDISDDGDYTVPVHGDRRGNPAVLLEIRNDLLGGPEPVEQWVDRLDRALRGTGFSFEESSADGGR